jgi:hypothetical protein
MKGRMMMRRRFIGAGLVVLAATLTLNVPARGQEEENVPVVPAGNAGSVSALLYARPFSLERPYVNAWTRELQPIRSGFILVLQADTALLRPRQTWMPALYVGTRPAEVTNVGVESGRVVVLVPGDTDLYSSPAYFGSVQLPERVDAARGALELAAARAIGALPFSREMVDAALRAGGAPLSARTIDGVYREVAGVIAAYSPQEQDLVDRYRLIPAE